MMIHETQVLQGLIKDIVTRGNQISIEIATDDQEKYGKNLIKRIQELSLLDLGDDKDLDKFLLDSAALSLIMMFHLKKMEESKPEMVVVPEKEEEAKPMKAEIYLSEWTHQQVSQICLKNEGVFECIKDITLGMSKYWIYVQKASTRKLIERHLEQELKWQ